MISKNFFGRLSHRLCIIEQVEQIENYEEAIKSDEMWECHHRLETHNSDGERRLVELTSDELKALDMYFNRPASELILLTRTEHAKIHNREKNCYRKGSKQIIYRKGTTNEKKVMCIETGETFESAAKASRFLGLWDGAVSKSIRRNIKAGGFHWKYN